MEQIKHVIFDKIEFEHRVKSKTIPPFGIFGASGFNCKEESRQFFNLKVCQKSKCSDWDPDGKNQASFHGETWFS